MRILSNWVKSYQTLLKDMLRIQNKVTGIVKVFVRRWWCDRVGRATLTAVKAHHPITSAVLLQRKLDSSELCNRTEL